MTYDPLVRAKTANDQVAYALNDTAAELTELRTFKADVVKAAGTSDVVARIELLTETAADHHKFKNRIAEVVEMPSIFYDPLAGRVKALAEFVAAVATVYCTDDKMQFSTLLACVQGEHKFAEEIYKATGNNKHTAPLAVINQVAETSKGHSAFAAKVRAAAGLPDTADEAAIVHAVRSTYQNATVQATVQIAKALDFGAGAIFNLDDVCRHAEHLTRSYADAKALLARAEDDVQAMAAVERILPGIDASYVPTKVQELRDEVEDLRCATVRITEALQQMNWSVGTKPKDFADCVLKRFAWYAETGNAAAQLRDINKMLHDAGFGFRDNTADDVAEVLRNGSANAEKRLKLMSEVGRLKDDDYNNRANIAFCVKGHGGVPDWTTLATLVSELKRRDVSTEATEALGNVKEQVNEYVEMLTAAIKSVLTIGEGNRMGGGLDGVATGLSILIHRLQVAEKANDEIAIVLRREPSLGHTLAERIGHLIDKLQVAEDRPSSAAIQSKLEHFASELKAGQADNVLMRDELQAIHGPIHETAKHLCIPTLESIERANDVVTLVAAVCLRARELYNTKKEG